MASGADITQLTDVPRLLLACMVARRDAHRLRQRSRGDGDIYVMDADGQRPFLLTQDDNGAEDRTRHGRRTAAG